MNIYQWITLALFFAVAVNEESLANTNDWKILAKLYREKKDAITPTCPMWSEAKPIGELK